MRVISPEEETALAWVATQFLSGACAKGKVGRVATADLGGISLQASQIIKRAVEVAEPLLRLAELVLTHWMLILACCYAIVRSYYFHCYSIVKNSCLKKSKQSIS